jgi:hypothetical protein
VQGIELSPGASDRDRGFFCLATAKPTEEKKGNTPSHQKRPMVDWLAHLELAIRHVTEGEARVARQRELARLKRLLGHPTDQSERLLELLENVLQQR